jgi:hypothetical protein
MAGVALLGVPLLASGQTATLEQMQLQQRQLEQQVRDQGARIAELERLLRATLSSQAPAVSPASGSVAAPVAATESAATPAPSDAPAQQVRVAAANPGPEYVPNQGFKLYESDMGQIYMRLFSYARYLNQDGLDPTYTDYFGNVNDVTQREDFQLNKFFLPFSGWFLDPKWRYYLYVWSANTAQGDPAQVVGAGNLSYVANSHLTLGAGITSLPAVRSTEGQFPYWLGVDDRLTSDEFFRGSYTTGIWAKGQIVPGLNYMAMIANNLSSTTTSIPGR